MKILIINSLDNSGGAAKFSIRLLDGLLRNKNDAWLIVRHKHSNHSNILKYSQNKLIKMIIIKFVYLLELILLKIHSDKVINNSWYFSIFPNFFSKYINSLNPDIVHLNWISAGFLPIFEISKIKAPIIWTLHDSWPFTGGCHIPLNCNRFINNCGKCPQLLSTCSKDPSYFSLYVKRKIYLKKEINFISPSDWLASNIKNSSVLSNNSIDIIPNGINTNIFKPINKSFSKSLIGAKEDSVVLLFGAAGGSSTYLKGFSYFLTALDHLISFSNIKTQDLEIFVFGDSNINQTYKSKYDIKSLGYITDDLSLSIIYSSADVFVNSSHSENLSTTIMESLSCGTPVVAFDVGGNSELIIHKKNGYLAKPLDSDDIAQGIAYIVSNSTQYISLSECGRNTIVQNFNIDQTLNKYLFLYDKIIAAHRK